MKTLVHKADSRGEANLGWLQSRHSFSFSTFYDPERMNFGALRVLNDDVVAAGMGFGTHPHDNMEIISIPLSGDLEHKDSMGNVATIRSGDVQVMSAGSGISHSEKNKNQNQTVEFLQIWLMPDTQNVSPRYDQITLESEKLKNQLFQILSPNSEDDGVWVHQQAWFSMGQFEESSLVDYKLHREGNGVYLFVLEGNVQAAEQQLGARDAMGFWETSSLQIKPEAGARVLLMEVPMS